MEILRQRGVRLIAINDGVDSARGDDDFTPFRNIINEWYAKDTSRKVKTALHAKFAAGQKICTYAPLGYRKHTKQRNKLIIDEETRWIIEKIFDLAVHGAGAAKIAKTLYEDVRGSVIWENYRIQLQYAFPKVSGGADRDG